MSGHEHPYAGAQAAICPEAGVHIGAKPIRHQNSFFFTVANMQQPGQGLGNAVACLQQLNQGLGNAVAHLQQLNQSLGNAVACLQQLNQGLGNAVACLQQLNQGLGNAVARLQHSIKASEMLSHACNSPPRPRFLLLHVCNGIRTWKFRRADPAATRTHCESSSKNTTRNV